MNFDKFVRELLRYDAEHMEADDRQMLLVWMQIIQAFPMDAPDSSKNQKK